MYERGVIFQKSKHEKALIFVPKSDVKKKECRLAGFRLTCRNAFPKHSETLPTVQGVYDNVLHVCVKTDQSHLKN